MYIIQPDVLYINQQFRNTNMTAEIFSGYFLCFSSFFGWLVVFFLLLFYIVVHIDSMLLFY